MCQLIGVEDVIGHTSAIDLKLFSIDFSVQHCPTTKADCSSTVVSSRYDCNFELVSNPVARQAHLQVFSSPDRNVQKVFLESSLSLS